MRSLLIASIFRLGSRSVSEPSAAKILSLVLLSPKTNEFESQREFNKREQHVLRREIGGDGKVMENICVIKKRKQWQKGFGKGGRSGFGPR